jgi:uncharacterized membrane protein YgcG
MLPVALVFCALVALSSAWALHEYPNPNTYAGGAACGNFFNTNSPAWVCDPDGFLSNAHDVDLALHAFADNAKQRWRSPFAVAVMRKMTPPLTSEQMAAGLHSAWGVGHPRRDDGILLLVSVEDRELFLSTGKAVKRWLCDMQVEQMLQNMKPYLQKEDVQGAVDYALR